MKTLFTITIVLLSVTVMADNMGINPEDIPGAVYPIDRPVQGTAWDRSCIDRNLYFRYVDSDGMRWMHSFELIKVVKYVYMGYEDDLCGNLTPLGEPVDSYAQFYLPIFNEIGDTIYADFGTLHYGRHK